MMKTSIKKNQNGFVAIIIASILMVIMALITLGFSRVVQNEQRQALDSELSKQAFYAAESGINVAASFPDIYTTDKTDCDVNDYNNGYLSSEDKTNNNNDIKFTCILIDPTPPSIEYGNDSITTNKSKIVPLITPSPISTISIEWRDNNSNGLDSCGSARDFEASYGPGPGTWNKIAPLNIELFGIPDGASFTRDQLIANQFGAIFYPCSGGSSTTTYASGQGAGFGKVIPISCSPGLGVEYECRAVITGVIGSQKQFFAKIKSIYNDVNVKITAEDGSGTKQSFSYAQAVVDSTGRANDVFRRLQARIPLYNNFNYPQAAIQTADDICKLSQVQATVIIDSCN